MMMTKDYMPLASTLTVAIWIADQVRKTGPLAARQAAEKIDRLFGSEFTSTTDDGSPSIPSSLIKEIARVAGEAVYFEPQRQFFFPA